MPEFTSRSTLNKSINKSLGGKRGSLEIKVINAPLSRYFHLTFPRSGYQYYQVIDHLMILYSSHTSFISVRVMLHLINNKTMLSMTIANVLIEYNFGL